MIAKLWLKIVPPSASTWQDMYFCLLPLHAISPHRAVCLQLGVCTQHLQLLIAAEMVAVLHIPNFSWL